MEKLRESGCMAMRQQTIQQNTVDSGNESLSRESQCISPTAKAKRKAMKFHGIQEVKKKSCLALPQPHILVRQFELFLTARSEVKHKAKQTREVQQSTNTNEWREQKELAVQVPDPNPPKTAPYSD